MYQPIKYLGQYHYGVSVYPPLWRRNPTQSEWNLPEPSYSQGQRSGFPCALPGPVCVAGWCDRRSGVWRCPQLTGPGGPAHSHMSDSLSCQKVDLVGGTWGWSCS